MASTSLFSVSLCNIFCLISDSIKTIRLLALDFREVMVDEGEARNLMADSSYRLNFGLDKKNKLHHNS